jgi:hypothetical protein
LVSIYWFTRCPRPEESSMNCIVIVDLFSTAMVMVYFALSLHLSG